MAPRATSSPYSVAGAEWLTWPGTVQVFSALSARGHEARAVGGAVRDTLLGRPVRDVDFATDAPPEIVTNLAVSSGLKAIPTGIEHGTITVVADHRGFEVTTLRKDVETFGRRAKVAFTDDWAADAGRRDFTINALYADADGTVFDPLGVISDIDARHIRFIGEARDRVREDFLRILRFFRFNAELEAQVFDEESLWACVQERGGLGGLSGERVADELIRLLCARGVTSALWKMYDYGLLVDVLRGVPNLNRLKRLVAIETERSGSSDAVLRLGILGVSVAEDAERLAKNLRMSNADRGRLMQFSELPDVTMETNDIDLARALYRYGLSGCRDAALKAWAASRAPTSDTGWQQFISRVEEMPVPEFPLQGSDLIALGMAEGPAMGDLLRRLETHWLERGTAATKRALLDMARGLIETSTGKTRKHNSDE